VYRFRVPDAGTFWYHPHSNETVQLEMGLYGALIVRGKDELQLDAERVLVLTRWGGRGKTSGLELGQVQTKGAHLFHVRGEQVTRFVVYFDREHAAADLGLPSEASTGSS
jgi:FtsP/CotA-like multicopper oxidase with cupredoxin domain